MSKIYQFPIEKTCPADPLPQRNRSAEIIIFPGVRIERRETGFNKGRLLPAVTTLSGTGTLTKSE
ncbi:MAG TPA: hypothetical protein ENJ99_04185 [Rhizobiales bacterium]|nr:hypothetical protein [Hyphomicrobiales bacterium]